MKTPSSAPIRPCRLDFSVLKEAPPTNPPTPIRKIGPTTQNAYVQIFVDVYDKLNKLMVGNAHTPFDRLSDECIDEMLCAVYKVRARMVHDMLNYGAVEACLAYIQWLAKLYQALLHAAGCWNVHRQSFPKV